MAFLEWLQGTWVGVLVATSLWGYPLFETIHSIAREPGGGSLVTLSDDRVSGDVLSTAYTAASFADKIGYPVALKALSPDLRRKRELGAIELDVVNAAAVKRAYANIVANVEEEDSIDILELSGCTHVVPLHQRLGERLAARVNAGHAQTHVIGNIRDLRVADFALVSFVPSCILQGSRGSLK